MNECIHCKGTGHSPEYKDLELKWYGYDNPEWKVNPYSSDGAKYISNGLMYNLEEGDIVILMLSGKLSNVPRKDSIPTPAEVREWVLKKFSEGFSALDHTAKDSVIQYRLMLQGILPICKHCIP